MTTMTVKAATPVENEYVSKVISGYGYQYTQTYVSNGITWKGDMWKKSGSATEGYMTNLHIVSVATQNALINITVPDEIYNCKVIELGDGESDILFGGMGAYVETLKIPSTVISIDDMAFSDWKALKKVTYEKEENLQYVGKESFKNCISLEEASIYTGTVYGERVYTVTNGEMKSLKTVNLKVSGTSSTVTVPKEAFYNCLKLETLNIDENISNLRVESYGFANCAFNNLVFDLIISVGEYGFAHNGFLEKIVFNKKTTLGKSAFAESFYEVEEIEKSVEFNKGDVIIDAASFYQCNGLKKIHFSDDIGTLYIYANAFAHTAIEELLINGSASFIGESAFTYMYDLKKIGFNSSSYTSFSSYCVKMPWSNTNIETLTINSNTVNMSGYNPFWGMTKLKSVTFGENVEYITGNVTTGGSYTNVYVKNPKVKVSLADGTEQSYTIYGYEGYTDSSQTYYKTGMNGWKENSSNPNIICKPIQESISANYSVGEDILVEGQSLDPAKVTIMQNFTDGSQLFNGMRKDELFTDIPYNQDDKYAGFSLKYGENGNNKLQAGENFIIVWYGDNYASFILKVEEKKVTDFEINYVGNEKIEGQTVCIEDFEVKNITYNDGEVVESSKEFIISGIENKLVIGGNTFTVTYEGKTKEVKVNASKKQLVSLSVAEPVTPSTPLGVKFVGEEVVKEDFIVKATYDNGDVVNDFRDYEISNPKLEKDENEITFIAGNIKATYKYVAVPVVAVELQVSTNENMTVVEHGQVNKKDITVKAVYNNGDVRTLTDDEYDFAAYDIIAGKVNIVTIVFGEVSKTISVKGVETAISSLEAVLLRDTTADTPQRVYYIGDTVKKDEIYVVAYYNNGFVISDYKDYTIVDGKLTAKSNKIKLVLNDNEEITTTVTVEAKDVVLEKISVEYKGFSVTEGSSVSKEDIVVTAYYNNGSIMSVTDYTIKDYVIEAGVKTSITVVYNGKEAAFSVVGVPAPTATTIPTAIPILPATTTPTSTPTPTAAITITETPETIATLTPEATITSTAAVTITETPEKTATPTPEKTATPTPEATITPTAAVTITETPEKTATPTPEATITPTAAVTITETPEITATPIPQETLTPTVTPSTTVAPTQKPGVTVSTAPTKTPTVTPTKKPEKRQVFKWKSSNKKIKLSKTSAKTTYKIYIKKTIKLTPSVTNGKVYYQIVKSGKKVGKNWKQVNKQILIKSDMKACVYIKYTLNGKIITQKTKGFIIDKKKPKIKVSGKRLKITDQGGSGIKSIKVDGKKVKNNCKLKQGTHKIVVTDKAGNKSVKTVKIP